jgi:hypothetical protein
VPAPSSNTIHPGGPQPPGHKEHINVHPAPHAPKPPQNQIPTGHRAHTDRAHRDRTRAPDPHTNRTPHKHADHRRHRTTTLADRGPHRPNAGSRRLLPRPHHPRPHLFPRRTSSDRDRRPRGLPPRSRHTQAPAPAHRTAPRKTTSGQPLSRSHHSVTPGWINRGAPNPGAPPPSAQPPTQSRPTRCAQSPSTLTTRLDALSLRRIRRCARAPQADNRLHDRGAASTARSLTAGDRRIVRSQPEPLSGQQI